jgi:hypothetical protein
MEGDATGCGSYEDEFAECWMERNMTMGEAADLLAQRGTALLAGEMGVVFLMAQLWPEQFWVVLQLPLRAVFVLCRCCGGGG